MKFSSPLDLIGQTPLLNISSYFKSAKDKNVTIWMKMERFNLGGSIKDRVALNMIEDAKRRNIINKNTHIIEPTSGNTGIGLAVVAAIQGYKITLVMPESMSIERRNLLSAYGANLVLTPKTEGMKGAIAKAQKLANTEKNSWIPNQFENPANPEAHEQTTSEIIKDLGTDIDYLITGVGTGGHITGCGSNLKKQIPHLKIFAVEPESSAVLSGEDPGPHSIQGIGAGFVPTIMDQNLLDGVVKVNAKKAFSETVKFTRELGVLVGISTGATLKAIEQKLPELKSNSTLLTFNYDTGERYLSTDGLFSS